MGKIDEKIKNKRCAINVRINPEMKDKFTAKVRSENRKAADVLREYIEYYTLGYVPETGVEEKNYKDVRTVIPPKMLNALNKACSDMSINRSMLIRSLISDWLKIKGYEVDKK